MAGDMEELYNFSLQADPLHSGSISFGRFENEALSWERRSSFSHNRYHEEVEKCSKPGSVIEKKAYFEAHFKKKALLHPNSSEFHSEKGYQTSENDVFKGREEFQEVSEVIHYAHFDEGPEGSAYQGEYVTGCKMENLKVLFPVPQMESASNSADVLVDGVAEDVNAEEIHQTEAGCDELLLVEAESDINGREIFLSVNEEPEMDVNHNLDDDAVNADESSKALVNDNSVNGDMLQKGIDPAPKKPSVKANKISLERRQHPSLKLRAATETGPFKPRVKSLTNPARVLTDISKTTSKDPAKSPIRRERESTLRTSTEKSSVKTDIRTTRTVQRTPILEDSRNQKAKFVHDNKSGEKETMRMKAGESQPSSLKAETRRYQPLHRLSCTVNSTKADTSSSAAVNSFKSNERGERRKEFYTELQQKMHAKEAEMNQMQVRRQEKTEAEIKQFRRSLNFKATPMSLQEKTEAEIKQFRRSLNFKATPMPSFYHVALPPGSDGKKALSSNNKINKARDKTTNPGSRAAGRSKSCLKEGSDQASSTNESVNTTERTDALEKTNCPTGEHSGGSASSQTLPSNQSCFLEVGVENKVVRRKEREKERDTSMYKHRVSEIHKVMKGQRAEGKQKVGAQRSSNEMARKDIKRSGIGSSSGLG